LRAKVSKDEEAHDYRGCIRRGCAKLESFRKGWPVKNQTSASPAISAQTVKCGYQSRQQGLPLNLLLGARGELPIINDFNSLITVSLRTDLSNSRWNRRIPVGVAAILKEPTKGCVVRKEFQRENVERRFGIRSHCGRIVRDGPCVRSRFGVTRPFEYIVARF
jgi:hypothetical protein